MNNYASRTLVIYDRTMDHDITVEMFRKFANSSSLDTAHSAMTNIIPNQPLNPRILVLLKRALACLMHIH